MMEVLELLDDHLRLFEPLHLEFLDENDQHYKLSSTVHKVGKDYLIINAPKSDDVTYELPEGVEVSIVFQREDGILYGHCKILGKQRHCYENAKLKISKPYNVDFIDDQKAKKYKIALKTQIEYFINKNDVKKKILNVSTFNINQYGVSYLDTEPLGKYFIIRCKVFIDNEEPVQAECRFVNATRRDIKGTPMYQTDLEFTNISREDSERILKKCSRKRDLLWY